MSLLGALMSIGYSVIAIVMCFLVKPDASVIYDPAANKTPMEVTFGIFNALTTVLFAYSGHNIALEIQATLPHPPSTVKPMMRGVHVTFVLTGICYFGVAIAGYWAFGTNVAGNVLLAFDNGTGRWVVAAANMMVVIHVGAAYQVYIQPLFQVRRLWLCV